MARQPGRVGQWVLPAAAVYISLTALWTICFLLGKTVPDAGPLLPTLTTVFGALAMLAGGVVLAGIAVVLLAILQHQVRTAESAQMEQVARRQNQLLEQIKDALRLSDRAKAVTFREEERAALQQAIQEDLAKQDWEAAYHLIDEMQRSFGYRAEAERMRQEVDQRRRETILASLSTETAKFREFLNKHDWDGARGEARALAARHPGQDYVGNLVAEVDDAREAYKRRLLSEFKQAIDRNEFDNGVAILKVLDQYLTPGEAAGLQEAARGVFRGKLHNLGVQFTMAVSERNWAEALRIGQQIISEFPNSRMAEEVRQNAEGLRKRAGLAPAAAGKSA